MKGWRTAEDVMAAIPALFASAICGAAGASGDGSRGLTWPPIANPISSAWLDMQMVWCEEAAAPSGEYDCCRWDARWCSCVVGGGREVGEETENASPTPTPMPAAIIDCCCCCCSWLMGIVAGNARTVDAVPLPLPLPKPEGDKSEAAAGSLTVAATEERLRGGLGDADAAAVETTGGISVGSCCWRPSVGTKGELPLVSSIAVTEASGKGVDTDDEWGRCCCCGKLGSFGGD